MNHHCTPPPKNRPAGPTQDEHCGVFGCDAPAVDHAPDQSRIWVCEAHLRQCQETGHMEKMRDLYRQDIQGLILGDNGCTPIAGLTSTEAVYSSLHDLQLQNVPFHSPREFFNLINRHLVATPYKATDEAKAILDNDDDSDGVVWAHFTDDGLVGYCGKTQTIHCELPNGEALPPIHVGG